MMLELLVFSKDIPMAMLRDCYLSRGLWLDVGAVKFLCPGNPAPPRGNLFVGFTCHPEFNVLVTVLQF